MLESLRLRAIDAAGNMSEPASLTFRVDGAAPRIQLTGAWYIWERGALRVSDDESGLAGVEIQIRDGQERWQPVTRAYETNGGSFTASIAWDRKFPDGTTAPIGEYDVLVIARDLAGNESRETARLLIPAPGVTPTALPTRTPLPTLTSTMPAASAASLPAIPAPPMVEPVETRAAVTSAFQSSNLQSNNLQSNNLQSNNLQSNNLLFGAAALTAIAAATGIVLAAKRRREDAMRRACRDEERAQAERVRAEAAAKTESLRRQKEQAREQAKIQNYLKSPWLKRQQQANASRPPLYPDPETADLTEAERLEQYKQTTAYQARQARYAEYYRQKAYEEFRQGERGEYVTPAQATLQDLGITLDPKFDSAETQTIINGASKLAMTMGGNDVFRNELGGVSILKDNNMQYGGLGDKHQVIYNTGSGWSEWRVVHELAHAWDANHEWSLSRELKQKTGGSFSLKGIIGYWLGTCDPTQPGCNHAGYVWGDVPPKGADGNFDQREDFAESVAAYLYPEEAKSYINENFPKKRFKRFQYDNFLDKKRGKFIEELMKRVAGGEK